MSCSVVELVKRDLLYVASCAVGETSMIEAAKLRDVAQLLVDMQSRLDSMEKDAARWREVLTNDEFVICDGEMNEYFKSKIEAIIDAALQSQGATK
jgi:hypothetical protein